ncbi:hypothetical protein [Scytonema sp. PRP1]|uniref:hypothetical protein n=1 Tax=Scytonema sp. PRP1 TaxID=3120513 RepID=UPI002FD37D70
MTVFLYQAVLQQELEEIDAIRAKRFSHRRFAIAILDIHLLQELTHPTRLAIAYLLWRRSANAERVLCTSALLLTADRTKTFCKVVIDRTPGRYPRTHNIELLS